jgi:hypothetical protein
MVPDVLELDLGIRPNTAGISCVNEHRSGNQSPPHKRVA